MAVSFIGGGNQSTQRKPPICHKSLTNFITLCCIEWTSPSGGFELTTSVVIGNDCIYIGSCKSNYHTITTMTATFVFYNILHTMIVSQCFIMSVHRMSNIGGIFRVGFVLLTFSVFCVVFIFLYLCLSSSCVVSVSRLYICDCLFSFLLSSSCVVSL